MTTTERAISYTGAYDDFQKQRQQFISLLQDHQATLSTFDMATSLEILTQLIERITADTFKILVIGEFKRGKTCIVNELARTNVLPSYEIPCTSLITEVKWGETPRAVLHLLEPGAE